MRLLRCPGCFDQARCVRHVRNDISWGDIRPRISCRRCEQRTRKHTLDGPIDVLGNRVCDFNKCWSICRGHHDAESIAEQNDRSDVASMMAEALALYEQGRPARSVFNQNQE